MSLSFATDFIKVWPLWGFYHRQLDTFWFKGEKELLSINASDGLMEHVLSFLALTGWECVGSCDLFIVYANPPTAFLLKTGRIELGSLVDQ